MSQFKEYNYTGLEIAVIGIACRFPEARHIDEFWENLKNGIESIKFFTDEELIESGVDEEELKNPNYVKAGAILDDIEYFDAPFFGYTSSEAEVMDPQIRICHEAAWHALEDAGYNPEIYDGRIGFYANASPNLAWEVYSIISGKLAGDNIFIREQFSNCDYLVLRICYNLKLTGPGVIISSTCSTSLVAVDMACKGLITGQCDIAMAGGVSIIIPQKRGYIYQEGMINSPDGHVRTFDASAGGTNGGEGIGIVVLKQLEEAIADGDNIYAIIKGSAINNDGRRKVGFTAPSIEGQSEVIRAALNMAEVEPESIGYIEAHGTGTPLGDPIEIEALKRAFNTDKKGFCGIGSVKTNIGHLDRAAGVAGFIKAVLAIKNKQMPPSLNFKKPNPKIDFENSPFYVVSKLTPWQKKNYPLRAGVSSFGIGGTNAHVILEEPPPISSGENSEPSRDFELILLSANTPSALERMTENFIRHLKENPGVNISNAAYTLTVGRKFFKYRKMALTSNISKTIDSLSAPNSWKVHELKLNGDDMPVVFMFPGQGAQYTNMGLELYKEPVFQQEMDRCFEILSPLLIYDLKEILYPKDKNTAQDIINQTEITQPAIFCFEYALAKLLMSWGIKPYAMIGHSIGEYTAACLSGVFSLPDALKLTVLRGRLMQGMPPGAMLSVPLPGDEVKHLLSPGISLAAVNSTSLSVISGTNEAVEKCETRLKEMGHTTRRLHTYHAFHSAMMDPILAEFEKNVRNITLNKPKIPFISNVTGQWIANEEAVSPGYWARHLRETVNFRDGLSRLFENGNSIFIEVGPGNSLSALLRQHKDKSTDHFAINMVRHPHENIPDYVYLTDKIGQLWLYGVNINWTGFYAHKKRYRLSLPTYPFERIKFHSDVNQVLSWLKRIKWSNGTALKKDEPELEIMGKPIGIECSNLYSRPQLIKPYAAPRNEIERKLVKLWQDFFSIQAIGIDDDFFELGGDSLKATMINSRIYRELHVIVPLPEIFKNPRIRELSGYIKDAAQLEYKKIEPVEKKEYYILSSAQKRLYFLQQLDKDGSSYNISTAWIMEGVLDKNKLEAAFNQLIERHESFRTSFITIGEEQEPMQRIHNEVKFAIEYKTSSTDFTGYANEKHNTHHDSSSDIHHFIRAFDLSKAPLLRAGLMKLEEEKHLFLLDIHHIISDGTSMNIVANDFMAMYQGKDLPILRLQYKNFSEWQNSVKQKETIKQYEHFWINEFAGEIPVLELPVDYPRPAVQSFEGRCISFEIDQETTGALKSMALAVSSTIYMLLLAIYTTFLSKLTNQEEIIVGSPVAGRKHADIETIVGMFVNTLALRNYPVGEKKFTDFLEEVKEKILKAFENQDYQYEDLVEKVALTRDTSRNPLFDAMFLLQNIDMVDINIPGLKLYSYPYENKTSKFDLSLISFEAEANLLFTFEYSTKLFKRKTIESLVTYFKNIVNRIISNPGIKIAQIEIIPEETRKERLNYFNENLQEPFEIKPIQSLLVDSFQKYGKNTAIESGSVQLTYAELEHRVSRISQWFAEHNIPPGSFIGIYIEDKMDIMASIIGILRVACIFVPLDTTLPFNRIENMIRLANIRVILTGAGHETIWHDMKNCNIEYFCFIDTLFYQSIKWEKTINFNTRWKQEDKVYVYFTSGTTGTPNAIVGKNKNLVQFLQWEIDTFAVDETYRVSQLTSVGFDAFLRDMFVPIFAGGVTCIPMNKEMLMESNRLIEWLDKSRINLVHCVPSLFRIINSGKLTPGLFSHLKYVLLSGEPINPNELQGWYNVFGRRIQLVNYYGPTETTMIKSYHFIEMSDLETGKIPAGRPISGTRLIILDRYMNICERGIGEIYIRTYFGTYGYLDNPELNARRFIKNPFSRTPGDLIYKTGDLGRELENGEIEILGRIDRLVKIRGIRIELENIENCLLKHDKIERAIVVSRKNGVGEMFLCAYIVLKKHETEVEIKPYEAEITISTSEWREYLAKELPEYMIPTYFIVIDKVPLTPNGKIDTKALPDYEIKIDGGYIAPRNTVEEKLAEVWAEILSLKKEQISIDGNFFQLGGHSLKASILISRIHKKLNVEVPLAEIFKTPTIMGLGEFISNTQATTSFGLEAIEKREFYELSYNQKRVWLLNQLQPGSVSFNIPGEISFAYNVDENLLRKALHILMKRHESLRTGFKMIDKEPVQYIAEEVEIPFRNIDISHFDNIQKQRERDKIHTQEWETPFDLNKIPLFRTVLIKNDNANYDLIFNIHHIITDGWSQEILKKEFSHYYEGFRNNNEYKPAELKIQYKDFAAWHNKQINQQTRGNHSYQFWKERLRHGLSSLDLPVNPRGDRNDRAGSGYRCMLDKETKDKLNILAKKNKTTLFCVMFSVYLILLHRLSGQEKIVCSIISAGRENLSLQEVMGFFVNSILFNINADDNECFVDFLHRISNDFFDVFQHQWYPIELIFKELKMKYPDVSVSFNMLNIVDESAYLKIEDDHSGHIEKIRDVKFDIEIYAAENENGISLFWAFRKSLFEPFKIEYIIREFIKLIDFFKDNVHKSYSQYKDKGREKKRIFKRIH